MGDPLSVAAGGIAVEQLLVSLINGGIKLRSEIKDVPEKLTHHLTQIDNIEAMLLMFEDEFARAQLPDLLFSGKFGIRRSIEQCRQDVRQIRQPLEDLQLQVDSPRSIHRAIGKAKAIWRKSLMAKYEQRLQTSLGHFQQLQVSYTMIMSLKIPTIIMTQLSSMTFQLHGTSVNLTDPVPSLILETPSSNEENTVRFTEKSVPNETSLTSRKQISRASVDPLAVWLAPQIRPNYKFGLITLTGCLELQNFSSDTDHMSQKEPNPRYRIRLRLPQWPSSAVWEFFVLQSQRGWTHHFRAYNIINVDSPIMNHIRRGGRDKVVQELQRYLTNGGGTIYDQTADGWTLLHSAALWQPEVSLFLIEQGADIEACDSTGENPISWVVKDWFITTGESYEKLLPEDISESNIIEILSRQGWLTSESWSYLQRLVCPDFFCPSSCVLRLKVARRILWYKDMPNIEILRQMLFEDRSGFHKSDLEQTPENERLLNSILGIVAFRLSCYKAWLTRQDTRTDTKTIGDYQDLAKGIVVAYGLSAWNPWPANGTSGVYDFSDRWLEWTEGDPLPYPFIEPVLLGYFYSRERSLRTRALCHIVDEVILPWFQPFFDHGVHFGDSNENRKLFIKLKPSNYNEHIDWDYRLRSHLCEEHLIEVICAPNLKDWKFRWIEPTDEYAGEFWHWAERSEDESSRATRRKAKRSATHGESTMPGEWID